MTIKHVLISIVLIFFGAILFAVLWYMTALPSAPAAPQTSQSPSTVLPISNSINNPLTPVGPAQPAVRTMTLAAQDGSAVVVNDFIHNGVTIPDTANAGHYLLAGNLGYCFPDPKPCQAASTTDFTVHYDNALQSFNIGLTKEPIGQARLDMEQFMLATLGITRQQLCSLNYLVGVTRYVNSQFTGKNLGFSFCPGATVLPK